MRLSNDILNCFYCENLIFISAFLSERLLRNVAHRTPLAEYVFPRYIPFKLEYWQSLYHQAPVHRTAQLINENLSLSLSFVVNAMLLRSKKVPKESPAVPEYEPNSRRYFTCSSPILNRPYLAYALTPFQSSSSTRRVLDLAAVSLCILSFPNQNSAVS